MMDLLSIEECMDMEAFEEGVFGSDLNIAGSPYKKTNKTIRVSFNNQKIILPIYKEKSFGVSMNFPDLTGLAQTYIDKMPKSHYPSFIFVNKSGIHLSYFDDNDNTKAITIANRV